MHSFFALMMFVALAGRAMALNIVFGGPLGNITASQVLAIPDGQLKTDCQSSCDPANQAIQTCGDTNDSCLCNNATVSAILACEQCMFTELINQNAQMPDPRAGSTPALAAYSAACLASQNITLPPTSIALTLPASWVGPFDALLNLPATIITVMIGATLGGSAILLLSNM
ncbi:hypothetical protein PILCRDRAFT_825345 [Piloderma croceum F 1598]|uniref:Extracellular membrane protein CFEM domain-containing protein n=1 Tax=Piloderma croceum (strain F 1598) TaxID=765440 RepID=A0A0C3FC95_PILCF|nr:hypothetical protein PILCRDRAFT_825345 [Piloderma croceum F 1598]